MARIRGDCLMRLLCINSEGYRNDCPLKEGEVYTLEQEILTNQGIYDYILVETSSWQWSNLLAFKKQRFIPISDIDETELVKEREQVLQEK